MTTPTIEGIETSAERALAPFLQARNVFSGEECDRIIEVGSRLTLEKGLVTAPDLQPEARDSSVALIAQGPGTLWIYDRLFAVVSDFNRKLWRFELTGSERMQFSRYGPGEYYDWHMDLAARGNFSLRKLTVTMQLSDPDNYEGGGLEVNIGSSSSVGSRERGSLVAFPSYALHRVLAVESGARHALSVWFVGEAPFR